MWCLFAFISNILGTLEECPQYSESKFSSQIQFVPDLLRIPPVMLSTLINNTCTETTTSIFSWDTKASLKCRFIFKIKCYTCNGKVSRVNYKSHKVNSITLRKPILQPVHCDLFVVFQHDLVNITCIVQKLIYKACL